MQQASMDAAALDVALDEDGRVEGAYAKKLAFQCRVWEDVLQSGDENPSAGPEHDHEQQQQQQQQQPAPQRKRSRTEKDGDAKEQGTAYLRAVTEASSKLDALSKREEEVDATFWIPAKKMDHILDEKHEDYNVLEALASRIFRIHTKDADYDLETSGVEWWVQLRDAPTETHEDADSAPDDATAAMAPTPQKRRCIPASPTKPDTANATDTTNITTKTTTANTINIGLDACNKSNRSESTGSAGSFTGPVAGSGSGSDSESKRNGNNDERPSKNEARADDDDDGDDDVDEMDEEEVSSIPFHIDKDETLSALAAVYVSPALSTVTYLSAEGAPTVVTPLVYSNEKAAFEYTADAIPGNMAVCYPQAGRHLVFDGRLMHGVPSTFARAHSVPTQETGSLKPNALVPPKDRRRITFLANVWLNHQPVGIEPLPAQVKRSIFDGISPKAPLSQRLDFAHEIKPTSCTPGLLSSASAPSADALAAMNSGNGEATTTASSSSDTQVFPLNEAPEDVAGIALPPPLSEGSFHVYTEMKYRPKLVIHGSQPSV